MNRKSGGPLYGIGGVTLLTVLLVLCLTMFSVLALSSAQADYRLSIKNAQAVTAYYNAENKALEMMRIAEETWPSGTARPSPAIFCETFPADMAFGALAQAEGAGILITADIRMENALELQVAVFLKPAGQESRWEIRQWQVLPPAQDETDIHFLPLFQPEQSNSSRPHLTGTATFGYSNANTERER